MGWNYVGRVFRGVANKPNGEVNGDVFCLSTTWSAFGGYVFGWRDPVWADFEDWRICGGTNALEDDFGLLRFDLGGIDSRGLFQFGDGFELAILFSILDEGGGL